MQEVAFTHVGITVSDLKKSVEFYEKVFGCKCRNTTHFDSKFFLQAPGCYNLPDAESDVAFVVTPNGITLEMFQFTPALEKTENVPWNKPAWTHIALQVENLPEFAKHMKECGVEFCMEVLDRFDGGHWVFVRDLDGNLIEVAEPMRKH